MKENNNKIHFRDCIKTNNFTYFSAVEVNGLFRQEEQDKNAEFVFAFVGEDEFKDNLHSKVFLVNGEYYFVPLNGVGVSVLSADEKEIETFPYKRNIVLQMINAYCIKDYIIMVPLNSQTPFLAFDVAKKEYIELNELENKIWENIEKKAFWLDSFSTFEHNEILYMAPCGINYIYICNTHDWAIEKLCIGEDIKIHSITFKDDKIYAICNENCRIYEIDIQNKSIVYMELEGIETLENIIITYKNDLYILNEESIIKIDEKKSIEKKYSIPLAFKERSGKYRLIAGVKEIDGILYIFTAAGGGTIRFDGELIEIIESVVSDQIVDTINNYKKQRMLDTLKKDMEKKCIVAEGKIDRANLEIYIKYIVGKDTWENGGRKEKSEC